MRIYILAVMRHTAVLILLLVAMTMACSGESQINDTPTPVPDADTIHSNGYYIFSGTPHGAGLKPNTEDIVDRNGAFLFFIHEAVAVNSSGEILRAGGAPAANGDELIKHSKDGMTDDEKAFHRVMAIMFPIRNALMYDIAAINQAKWDELVSELKIRGIKDKTFTDGATPRDNYYGRQGIFELAKNPDGKDIHHDIMKFLEEAGLYFLCHVTSDDFSQMLKDTHPAGHNPCKDAGITSKISFSTYSAPIATPITKYLDRVTGEMVNEFFNNTKVLALSYWQLLNRNLANSTHYIPDQ